MRRLSPVWISPAATGAAKTRTFLAHCRGRRARTRARTRALRSGVCVSAAMVNGRRRSATGAAAGGAARRTPTARAAGPTPCRSRARGPRTICSATASGVVAKGWASMPAVMRVCTKPGRTTMTRAPVPDQRVAQALGEGVETGLGRAVDVVGLAGPLGGHRRQHDQRAVALGPEPLGHHQARRHRAHEVDAHGFGRRLRVGVEVGLVAEHAEGDQHQVEVGVAIEHPADDGGVRRRVERVEGHDVDRGAQGLAARRPHRSTAAGSRTASTTVRHRRSTRRRTVASGDLRGTAQDEHRLGRSEGVLHVGGSSGGSTAGRLSLSPGHSPTVALPGRPAPQVVVTPRR